MNVLADSGDHVDSIPLQVGVLKSRKKIRQRLKEKSEDGIKQREFNKR